MKQNKLNFLFYYQKVTIIMSKKMLTSILCSIFKQLLAVGVCGNLGPLAVQPVGVDPDLGQGYATTHLLNMEDKHVQELVENLRLATQILAVSTR